MASHIVSALFFLITFHSYGQDGFVGGQPKLAYWKVGSKGETVIVINGGYSATHDYLRPEFDQLSRVAKVIYYDQRGLGKSGSADSYAWQVQVANLNRIIRRIRHWSCAGITKPTMHQL